MSKGSPIVSVRIPDVVLQMIDQAVFARRHHQRHVELIPPNYTRAAFIAEAINAKLTEQAKLHKPKRGAK